MSIEHFLHFREFIRARFHPTLNELLTNDYTPKAKEEKRVAKKHVNQWYYKAGNYKNKSYLYPKSELVKPDKVAGKPKSRRRTRKAKV